MNYILKKLYQKFYMHFGGNEAKIRLARKDGVKIGDGCTILGTPHWGSEPFLIEIGNNVRITSGVQFVNHDGGIHVLRREWSSEFEAIPEADLFGRIKVGNNVFIGIKTIILPGVTIGDNVIIGAGSIVTKDIPSNCVAAGVPARVTRKLEDYYKKNRDRIDKTKNMDSKQKKEYLEEHYSGS